MLGEDNFASIDIRVRVSGGGHTSQIYAIRQAIAKAAVAYWAKYYDASHALSLKKSLVDYDRTLLIADPRRMEPKKFGGGGARARRQKRFVLSVHLSVDTDPFQLPISVCGTRVCTARTSGVMFMLRVHIYVIKRNIHMSIILRGHSTIKLHNSFSNSFISKLSKKKQNLKKCSTS